MSYGVTDNGFILKTLENIIADMETEATNQFGNDIDLTYTSPLKKFIEVVAAQQYLLWQALEEAYYSGYLDTVSGTNLDKLIVLIGLSRQAAQKATGQVTFSGVDSTVIPANTEVQTADETPIVFRTDAPVTISGGTATANITAKVAGQSGNVSSSTITVMTEPIAGVTSVTNASATTGGSDAESDEELRNRVKLSLSSAGAATIDAIYAGVLGVVDVASVLMEENDTVTDYTPSGLPPKSFRVTVLGGDGDDIAQAIFDNKAAGIQSYGDSSGNAISDDGTGYTMYFRRPTETTIYVDVTVTHDDTYPADGDAQVENAVIEYIGGIDLDNVNHLGLPIGGDVIFYEVVSAVLSIQGVTDAVVKVDTSSPPTGTSNITIGATEKAKTSTTAVTVS